MNINTDETAPKAVETPAETPEQITVPLSEYNALHAILAECVESLADHVELEARRTNLPAAVVCPCKTTTLAKARAILGR